jgi:Family of unknown function (DUF5519)
MSGAGEIINAELRTWPGVVVETHRFGGLEYLYGRKEMGHVHGDRLADLPFPRRLRDTLIAEGRAEPHHVLPETGWVSRWINSPDDAGAVIALFRINYERYSAGASRENP